MKNPSKKEIREAVAKLKDQNSSSSNSDKSFNSGKLAAKKSTQRIRKQGV